MWQIRVFGIENIPPKGGVLLASNHQSYLDPPLIAGVARRDVHIMARASLFKIPGLRALIVSYKAFPIERGRVDVTAVKTAIDRLKKGYAVLVFPEGTRTRDGKVATMKPGFRLLSDRADAPIVPVLLEGVYDIWPPHQALPGGGLINVNFGPPFRLRKEDDAGVVLRERVMALTKVPRRLVKRETMNGQ